ncbi:hypothetical protein JCM17380_48310 [Desulfosporosinus burensis]
MFKGKHKEALRAAYSKIILNDPKKKGVNPLKTKGGRGVSRFIAKTLPPM